MLDTYAAFGRVLKGADDHEERFPGWKHDVRAQPHGQKVAGYAMIFRLESPAFAWGAELPKKYTVDGEDISPPLTWSGVPAGVESFALIVEDPDAPTLRTSHTWAHWVVYNIPASARALVEGASGYTPRGWDEGLNDWQRIGYTGPAPPAGRHQYIHRIYALDRMTLDLKRPTATAVRNAMGPHVLAEAALVGTYARKRLRATVAQAPGRTL